MLFVDASTLILAAKAELLDLLINASHNTLTIATEVEKEATKKKSFDALLIGQRISEKKIAVKKVKDQKMVEKIEKDFSMHKGEAETIVLCMENNGKAVATDDYNAMKACMVLKIEYITILGILLRLYEEKKLDKEDAKLKFERLAQYGRYSTEIIDDFTEKLEG
ncbi:MAG: hypothetical protein HY393_01990 [Candidatus Diapherotrites archaeon]|nr:hypothetical protein [Candidatus Diapherotrites archaeon]